MNRPEQKLNRYTTLPVLLDLLKRAKLVLLDPKDWEDKNDSGTLLEYKRRKAISKLFAICFSRGDETIHDWKCFADGVSGCCVEFNAWKLKNRLRKIEGVRFGRVIYRKLRELDDEEIDADDIPFTKRWPYRIEREFRVIWEGDTKAECFEIPIDLRWINKITISQRMPKPVYDTIRAHLRDVFADPAKRINHSTVFENQEWLEKFKPH